jgi:hypothetical protein
LFCLSIMNQFLKSQCFFNSCDLNKRNLLFRHPECIFLMRICCVHTPPIDTNHTKLLFTRLLSHFVPLHPILSHFVPFPFYFVPLVPFVPFILLVLFVPFVPLHPISSHFVSFRLFRPFQSTSSLSSLSSTLFFHFR